MDGGPLTAGPIPKGPGGGHRPTWKLREDIAPKVQGIAVTGFGELPEGRALFLELPEPCSGAWIAAIESVVPVTSAVPRVADAACALAFSASALRKMGFDATTLASFSQPLRLLGSFRRATIDGGRSTARNASLSGLRMKGHRHRSEQRHCQNAQQNRAVECSFEHDWIPRCRRRM